MSALTSWSWAWLIWFLLTIGSFLILEGLALANRAAGDTLSEQVWAIYSGRFGKFVCWMVTAFLVWLTVHFATRGRWG